eukprot:m.270513 g.270513  ORF g.270513 m.270513 type:complete len:237 (-) comp54760_c0_seq1:1889-2599(-)
MACILVGGTGHIGRAVAHALAATHTIFVCSRQVEVARQVAASLPVSPSTPQHFGIGLDVRDPAAVNAVFSNIASVKRPSVLVNAAGISIDRLLLRVDQDSLQAQMTTNLLGSIYTSKAALKYMLPAREGVIINISSVAGLSGNPGQTIYSSTKAGLIGFSKSLAKEVAPKGIRVNVLAPGYVASDMTQSLDQDKLCNQIPLQRLGTVAEMAHAVKYLVEATYATGQVLVVDGGLTA